MTDEVPPRENNEFQSNVEIEAHHQDLKRRVRYCEEELEKKEQEVSSFLL